MDPRNLSVFYFLLFLRVLDGLKRSGGPVGLFPSSFVQIWQRETEKQGNIKKILENVNFHFFTREDTDLNVLKEPKNLLPNAQWIQIT